MSSAVQPSGKAVVSSPPHRPLGAALLHTRVGEMYTASAIALSLVALTLRLFHIDHESLWLDEGYTFFFSQLPLKQLVLIGGAHEHPPLYYLIVHILLSVHPWFLVARYISAVAGALSVLAVYALGRRMFGSAAGLCAAALLTFSPFQAWWSRDGRAYELAGLCVLLSYITAFRALDRPRRRTWIAYGVCLAVCLYSEYTTVLVLVPQALLLRTRHRESRRALIAAWVLAGLLFAPWLTMLVRDAASVAGDYWVPAPRWSMVQNTVLEFLGLITPCSNFPCVGAEAPLPVIAGHEPWIATITIAAVAVIGAGALLARRLEWIMATLWLTLPFAIVLILAIHRSLYLDRVFLDATFALYLLLGGLVALAGRHRAALLALLLVACMCAGSAANLRMVYGQNSNPDWRALAHDLQAAYRPGQAVIYNPAVLHTLLRTYLPTSWHASREQLLWYHGYLDVPGWQHRFATVRDRVMHDPGILPQLRPARFDTILRDIQLQEAIRGERQVWLVTQQYPGLTDNRRWLTVHNFHLLVSEIYPGNARLELWDRGEPRDIGPSVVRPEMRAGWVATGSARIVGTDVVEQGRARLTRSFPVSAGAAYSANVEYRGYPGSHPLVRVRVYDAAGHTLGRMIDDYGAMLDSFPRTEWYDMPVNGVWLSQPFGFVAPPGAVHATITLSNTSGVCAWRNIGIFQER